MDKNSFHHILVTDKSGNIYDTQDDVHIVDGQLVIECGGEWGTIYMPINELN